jgi:hypothetical protein
MAYTAQGYSMSRIFGLVSLHHHYALSHVCCSRIISHITDKPVVFARKHLSNRLTKQAPSEVLRRDSLETPVYCKTEDDRQLVCVLHHGLE